MSKELSSPERTLEILKRLNQGEKLNIFDLTVEYNKDERTILRTFSYIDKIFGKDIIKKDKNKNRYVLKKELLDKSLIGTDLAILMNIINILKTTGLDIELESELEDLYKENENIYKFNNNPFEELRNKTILKELEKAIKYRQKTKIKYIGMKNIKNTTVEYYFKPYKIVLLNENFYLVGEEEKQKMKFLRITGIQDIKVEATTFYIDKKLESFINKLQTPFAKYDEKETYLKVNLLVDKSISKYFKSKKYLSSQKIIEIKDNGNIVVEYNVSNKLEIIPLIIDWLPNIEILSPIEIKKDVLNSLERKISKLKKR